MATHPKTAEREPSASADATQDVVYLSQTGKRYHRQGCRTLQLTPTPVSRCEAQAQGRTPCRVCNP